MKAASKKHQHHSSKNGVARSPTEASMNGDSGPRHGTTVSISNTETWAKDKRYTVYKVAVATPDRSYFIFRRYAEFSKLYDTLKKQYPGCGLKLPGKKFFGNNFDPSFIKSRREGLNDFIQKLLNNQSLFEDSQVQDFLQLHNPRNTEAHSVDEYNTSTEDCNHNDPQRVDLGPSEKELVKPTDFEFLKVIGKGSFGKVLLAKHKAEGHIYAVKVLQKKQILKRNEAKHIMAERNVLLKNVQHPFLVGLHYSFQTRDKLYFILDYVNGGELFFHLQKERYFPENRAKFYAAEIASALGYLHSLNIVYRDLKPENLLLDSTGHIRLTDFGLCKENVSPDETTSTFCGTPEYLAPEVLKKEAYDRTVDWWCLGAVTYEMVYGLPPFYSRDTSEMYNNILYKPLRLRSNVTPEGRSLLEGLLQKDKNKRLGAKNDFQDIREHIFFNDLSWADLEAKKLSPPYNPDVRDHMDLKHFDPEFVREPIPASLARSAAYGQISVSVQQADKAFEGFSYAPAAEEAFL